MKKHLNILTFDFILKQLNEKPIEIITLGGKSKFKVNKIDKFIILHNSRNRKLKIDKAHWDKVMDRINELPDNEKGMTSRYSSGNKHYNWQECPNRIFTPYIPAIVKYFNK